MIIITNYGPTRCTRFIVGCSPIAEELFYYIKKNLPGETKLSSVTRSEANAIDNYRSKSEQLYAAKIINAYFDYQERNKNV